MLPGVGLPNQRILDAASNDLLLHQSHQSGFVNRLPELCLLHIILQVL